jgi:hypothetical protein
MGSTRRRFTDEYKEQAVGFVIDDCHSAVSAQASMRGDTLAAHFRGRAGAPAAPLHSRQPSRARAAASDMRVAVMRPRAAWTAAPSWSAAPWPA